MNDATRITKLSGKSIIALVTIGVATWVAAMSLGHFVVLLSGIPASSGLLNGLVVPFLLVLGARAIPTNWSVTIPFLVYGALSIPVLLLGPPGLHKILVALVAGVATDILLRITEKLPKHLAYMVAFSIWGALLAGLARLAYHFLALPGKDKFIEMFWTLAIFFVVEAAIGSFLASRIFDKYSLDIHPVVQRIRSKN